MKLSFDYLKDEILKFDAKSEYRQASVVILRKIFKDAGECDKQEDDNWHLMCPQCKSFVSINATRYSLQKGVYNE
jgi:hypothetical protein